MPSYDPDDRDLGLTLHPRTVERLAKLLRDQIGRSVTQRDDRTPQRGFGGVQWHSFINDTGDTIPGHAVMKVSGATAVTAGADVAQTIYQCQKPDGDIDRRYAFNSAAPVESGGSGLCCFEGPVRALYESGTPALGEAWGPRSGQWGLSKGHPSILIVDGVVDAAQQVLLGTVGIASRAWATSISAPLPAGGSITVTLSDGTSADATNQTSQTLPAGNAIAIEDAFTGDVLLTGTVAPSTGGGGGGGQQIWHVTAGTTIAANGTGGVTLTGGTTATAQNWSTQNAIESGDKLTVYLDSASTGTQYFAIPEVIVPREYKGVLSGTLATTDTTISVASMVALDGRAGTTALTACSNHFSLAGPNGAKCLVGQDLSSASTAFILKQVQHYNCTEDE